MLRVLFRDIQRSRYAGTGDIGVGGSSGGGHNNSRSVGRGYLRSDRSSKFPEPGISTITMTTMTNGRGPDGDGDSDHSLLEQQQQSSRTNTMTMTVPKNEILWTREINVHYDSYEMTDKVPQDRRAVSRMNSIGRGI